MLFWFILHTYVILKSACFENLWFPGRRIMLSVSHSSPIRWICGICFLWEYIYIYIKESVFSCEVHLGLCMLGSYWVPGICSGVTGKQNSSDSVKVYFKTTVSQFSSVAQSCPTFCDPMDRSTPGFPVHHQLPELTQTHVHRVSDAIDPSHPLSFPSPPAFNLSQHQGLFKWFSSSHQVAEVLEFQLQHQSFQWIFRTDFL